MGFWKVTGEIGKYGIWSQLIFFPILILLLIIGLVVFNITYKPRVPSGILDNINDSNYSNYSKYSNYSNYILEQNKLSVKKIKGMFNIIIPIVVLLLAIAWIIIFVYRANPGLKDVVGVETELALPAAPLLAAL